MISAAKSKAYRRFVTARDKALERLYMSAQGRSTQALAESLQHIYDGIAARYLHIPTTEQMTVTGDAMTKSVSQLIDFEFSHAQLRIVEAIRQLRKLTMTLTVASETEAITRAQGNALPKAQKHPRNLNTDDKPMATGGTIEARVSLALNRLKTKIMDALQLSRVLGETTQEAMKRIRATFPKLKRVEKPKKLFTPIREADQKQPFSVGLVDEDTWDQIEQDYLKPFQPKLRDPRLYFDVQGDEGLSSLGVGEGVWMGWELEQQITSDFVDTVRNGQVKAANDRGINDFVWITVFGPTTCESCKWRNGLTSSEIEAKLDKVDDDFDATVPPAHPSCRCQLAPMVEELGDEPEELGDFSEWLTS